MTLIEQIDAAIAARHGTNKASAAKRGRHPNWPYIGIIVRPDGTTYNPLGRRAFRTRQEAIDAISEAIDEGEKTLRERLAEPRHRSLRESYGLPREIGA